MPIARCSKKNVGLYGMLRELYELPARYSPVIKQKGAGVPPANPNVLQAVHPLAESSAQHSCLAIPNFETGDFPGGLARLLSF